MKDLMEKLEDAKETFFGVCGPDSIKDSLWQMLKYYACAEGLDRTFDQKVDVFFFYENVLEILLLESEIRENQRLERVRLREAQN